MSVSQRGNQCTLRAAIEEANDTTGADAIRFDISGKTSVKTISPTSELPEVTDPVTINGYTRPGARTNRRAGGNDAVLKIQLNGANAGAGTSGLVIRTSDSVIKGLAINRFLDNGISGSGATGNRVEGNFVGTNASGTKDLGNSVRSNRIFANGELGIDLVGNGVTGNDPDDGDTGPNNLQNFPVITSVTQSSLPFNPTSISGTLDSVLSTSTRTQNFTIQCFAAAPDPPTVPWWRRIPPATARA